ncbi:MAG: sensor histidine kinase [Acidimicrobiia bacterium]|jgi:signal transduction histidine kinase
MRRRFAATIVGTVVVTLVLAGACTLALAELGARRYAEDELRQQTSSVSESLSDAGATRLVPGGQAQRVLLAVRQALRLEGAAVAQLEADGTLRAALPAGVALDERDIAALRRGETVSGRSGRLVWAASLVQRGDEAGVVVLSDRVALALGGSWVWFASAAGVVVLLALLVSSRLAGSLAGPVRQAADASRRIAGGDLGVRVPEPAPGADDELAELNRSINAMAASLERSRRLDQQLLLSVSHDLRTPLTSIQGYAEGIADGTVTDARQAGSVILAESRRLSRLVRDLLELARLDARQLSIEPVELSLLDLVAACLEGFAPEASAAGVSLLLDPRSTDATVHADPDRLAQVMANLIENALRFARSQVVVQLSADGARVRVCVDDDGPGIEPDDRSQVFERLFVARRAPRRAETSSGLGLAIVRQLVDAMGGRTGVDDSPLGGARLWFDLPSRPSQDPNNSLTRR